MSQGIFTHIAASYFKAINNLWRYLGHTIWLLKPIVLLLAIVYSFSLGLIGLVFCLGIILDWLGKLTDAGRRIVISIMKHQSDFIDNGLFSFLFRPILLVAFSPLLIVFLIIPKLSSDPVQSFIANESAGMLDGSGAFKMVNGLFFNAIRRVFAYVADTYLLLKPIAAAIAIFYWLILIILGLFFALLIPLDWISHIVELIRQSIARAAYKLQKRVDNSFWDFLFMPMLLILLAPLFVVGLIIPKVTSQVIM